QHKGDVFVRRGGGDDDLLDGRTQVRLGLGAIGKVAGRFDDDLRANGSPVQLSWVALGPHLDLLPIHGDEVFAGADLVLQVAEDRVVLEQVGQGSRAGQVVDGNKINLRISKCGAQNVAANAAEAVDSNLYCHVLILLLNR